MCVGGARDAIGESAQYAAQRKQFGQPIATFGAIKHKLGEMIARTYAVESLHLSHRRHDRRARSATRQDGDAARGARRARGISPIEASIAKVAGSETLDFVLDENIQIHGGNGFVRDYPAERHYRDARVNRIFEGTNEINRLLIPGMLARRAVEGRPPLIAAAKALQDELLGPPSMPASDDAPLADERRAVDGVQEDRADGVRPRDADVRREARRQQEVLMLRGRHPDRRLQRRRAPCCARCRAAARARSASLHADAARVFVNDAAAHRGRRAPGARRHARRRHAADDAGGASAAAEGDADQHGRFRRRLADEAVARGGYIF